MVNSPDGPEGRACIPGPGHSVKVRAAEEYRQCQRPFLPPTCAAVSALVSAHPSRAAPPWHAPRLRHTLYFLGVRFVQLDWSGTRSPQLQVEHLDEHRKRHREVDVALRNVSIQPLSNQGHPDEQQKS